MHDGARIVFDVLIVDQLRRLHGELVEIEAVDIVKMHFQSQ